MNQENSADKQPLIRYVNRQQMSWRAIDVEKLINEDHPARAIWELVGRLDLSSFYASIASSAVEGGRPAYDIDSTGSFNLSTWQGTGGVSYTVSANVGVLSSTQSGGSIY